MSSSSRPTITLTMAEDGTILAPTELPSWLPDEKNLADVLWDKHASDFRCWWSDTRRPPVTWLATNGAVIEVSRESDTQVKAQLRIARQEAAAAALSWELSPVPMAVVDGDETVIANSTMRALTGTDAGEPLTTPDGATRTPLGSGTAAVTVSDASATFPALRATQNPVLIIDSQHRMLGANDPGNRLRGDRELTDDALLELSQFMTTDEAERLLGLVDRASQLGRLVLDDVLIVGDGIEAWHSAYVFPIGGVCTVVLDALTSRKSTSGDASSFTYLFEHLALPAVLLDRDARILRINAHGRDHFNDLGANAVGMKSTSFLADADRERFQATLRQVGQTPQIAEVGSNDGSVIFRLQLVELPDPPAWLGSPGGVIASQVLGVQRADDPGDNDRDDDEVRYEFITAHYRERQRLAQAIHDDVIGHIAAARHAIEAGTAATTDIAALLSQAEAAARLHQDDLGAFSSGRRTEDAIRHAHHQLSSRHPDQTVALGVFVDPAIDAIDERSRSTIISVVRQALANVYRHARASQVDVTVDFDGSTVRLTIADDGDGFPNVTDGQVRYTDGHLGLQTMDAQVRLHRGRIWFRNRLVGGASVEVELPLPDTAVAGPEGPAT